MSDDRAADVRDRVARAQSVVVKIGSQLIEESPAGRPAQIADEISAVIESGRQVVLVSSGAIALGLGLLGRATRPTALATLQAAAAVGQNRLLKHWEHGFATHGLIIGQVLLTHDDLADRGRFLNARSTLRALLAAGAVPIVNENDTVATDEIKYGDNDLLAALVCNLVGADAMVMLTDVDGVLDAPPDEGGRRIPVIVDVDTQTDGVTSEPDRLGLGSGGMRSKIEAARAAARNGVTTVVASGRRPGVIASILGGDDIGTAFLPEPGGISSRKHWIAYGAKPAGAIVVDDGAHRALTRSGRSLLSPGIIGVEGSFSMGDVVSLHTRAGAEFARGLAAYPAADVRRLAGVRSADIEDTLGYKYLDEVIHRDDLVLL